MHWAPRTWRASRKVLSAIVDRLPRFPRPVQKLGRSGPRSRAMSGATRGDPRGTVANAARHRQRRVVHQARVARRSCRDAGRGNWGGPFVARSGKPGSSSRRTISIRRSSPTVIGDPSVSFSASCLGLSVTLASRDSRQNAGHDYGRCPVRTGDLLLVRREQVLRSTAACRPLRPASGLSLVAAAVCCGMPLPERFHVSASTLRGEVTSSNPWRSGALV